MADVDYTYGYYEHINPLRIPLAFLKAGIRPPRITTACELGFGQGVSINVHAVASEVSWHGTDFNPAQVAFARELAQGTDSPPELEEAAFAQYCARDDLPDFDYVALHGIWSWISDDNRATVIDFLRRKLKPGGVLYLSYNSLPAWSEFIPIRNLMLRHTQSQSAGGLPLEAKIKSALEFATQTIECSPAFRNTHPAVGERLKKMATQQAEYLAHEFFNADWHPMDFASVAQSLQGAKIDFACSATFFDHIDALQLSEEQRTLINSVRDPILRETTRDLLLNQQFRRDYWVKGGRKIDPASHSEAFLAQQVVLIRPKEDLSLSLKTSVGEANLNAEVYQPILDALQDYQAVTVEDLSRRLKGSGIKASQLLEALTVLCGANYLAPAQRVRTTNIVKSCQAFNDQTLERAKNNNDQCILASPITGGGCSTDRSERLFLLAIAQGKANQQEWAEFAVGILMGQGQFIIEEGKTLRTKRENVAAMLKQAEIFARKRLPVLKALQSV